MYASAFSWSLDCPTAWRWYFLLLSEDKSVAAQSPSTVSASASTLAPGAKATASVTQNGDALAFAFGIPQGEQGPQGAQGPKGDNGTDGALTATAETGVYALTATDGKAVRLSIAPNASDAGAYEITITDPAA